MGAVEKEFLPDAFIYLAFSLTTFNTFFFLAHPSLLLSFIR